MATARRLTSDPCTDYFDKDTKQLCKECDDSYELFIMSPKIVHCASVDDPASKVCTIESILPYAGAMQNVKNLLAYFIESKDDYGDIVYHAENSYHKNLCINQQLYYTRTPLYVQSDDCDYKGKKFSDILSFFTDFSDTPFYCDQFNAPDFFYPDILNTPLYLSKYIQCFSCYQQQYNIFNINTRQQLRYWAEYGIYVTDCLPVLKAGETEDICGVPLVMNDQLSCQANEYIKQLDPKDPTKVKCTECSDDFGQDCAACDKTGCKMCRLGYFYNTNGYFNYVQSGSKEVEKRREECVYDNCPVGQCRDFELNICTKASNQMAKCLRCSHQDANTQICQMCQSGYKPSTEGTSCEPISNAAVNQSFFVSSTNSLHFNANCMAKATNYKSKPKNGDTDFDPAKINPQDITKPSPFLFHAWIKVLEQGETNKKVNATIYLGRGIHFLFSCTPDKDSIFVSTNYSCLYNYCNGLDLQWQYSSNDNIDITIMPLECDLESRFEFDSDEQTAFREMCVNYAIHGKPTIYVNNPTTYFNVTGRLAIKNLLFSGINALPVGNDTIMDFSILPHLLCVMPNEPNGLLDPNFINGTKNSNTQLETYLKFDLKLKGFGYNCSFYSSPDLVPKRPPTKWGQNQTCLKYNPKSGNKAQTFDNAFPSEYQSTKSCKGEPYSDGFFDFKENIYYNRRRTLFNLYSFAEHQTIRNQTPELIIENSQFEYFLHKDYESLINIESYTLNQVTYNKKTYGQGKKGDTVELKPFIFYTANGADRGGKITIINSVFKHSRFCKGMIVYRPSFYLLNNEDFQTIINQTNLFMNRTLKNSSDSFIIMKGSSFINLNAYTQVRSIGKTSKDYNSYEIANDYIIDGFLVPYFLNKGIVLNVEDFGGRIEVFACTFDKNFHYIPSILYNGETKGDQQLSSFVDVEKNELYFTICNNKKDAYFFGSSQIMTMLGAQQNEETESLFNTYEKLSLIYVARNKNLILIKGSSFTQNIGSFGGAITIDSPNWNDGNQPHVVLHANTFDKNMAYFSGNAVYITPTMQFSNIFSPGQQCAGVNIISNIFTNNLGLKVHNGGALSVVCSYQYDNSDLNYDSTSDYSDFLIQNSSSVFNNATYMTVTSQADGQLIGIQKASLNIQGNQFTNNYSGMKGTAVYIVKITRVRLYGNTFFGNGPVYAMAENLYSVYKKFFSGRPMTFTDPECSDEFQFLQSCNNIKPIDVGLYGGLQWPVIKGAIYIEFCSYTECFNPNLTQEVYAGYNRFQQNMAGPALNAAQTLTASQIYILNGKNVTISNCLFTENRGYLYYFDQFEQRKLTKYFPDGYIENSHSPLINLQIGLPMDALNDLNITLTIKDSQFMKNKNIQVLGLGNSLQYQGSLINIMNYQNYQPLFNQLVTFTLQDCTIRDNFFIGANSALVYSSKVITKIIRNQFFNNGRFFQATPKWISLNSNRKKFVTSLVFPFTDISHFDYQQNGCIWLSSSIEFPYYSIHEFINNTFSHLFTYQGSAYTFTGMDYQQVLIQGNKYSMLTAMRGPVLYWTANKETATVKMNKESVNMIFAGTEGAISINPTTAHQNQILIYNSNFTNVYAEEGSVLFLRNIGKFIVDNCIFNQTQSFLNLRDQIQFFKTNFRMTQYNPLNYFVDDVFLNNMFTLHKPKSGYIDAEGVYKKFLKDNGDDTDPILFQGKLFQGLDNPEFTFSVVQSSQFLNNNADQQAAIYCDVSKIKVKNTKIANNKVTDYGIIGHEGLSPSEIIIENVQFLNNTAKKRCSGFYVGQSKASLTNTTFLGNKAYESATVYVENNANLTCQNCTFQENWADDGSALYIQNNANTVQKIANSLFINNRASTNVMNIQYSNVEIYNTTFLDNIASEVNHGLTLIGSKAKIENVTVNYQNKDFLNSTPSNVDTGFINLNYRSSLTLSSSLMRNCRGSIGAVFTVTGGSSLNIDRNTTFINCTSFNGEVLHASSAKLIQIQNAVFQDNIASSDILIEQSLSIIKDSKFVNSKYNSITVISSSIQLIGNLFYDTKLSVKDIRATMSPSNITQITSFIGQKGKGLYCKCNQQSLIANNTFRSLSAEMGAALFLSSETPISNPLFSIKNNVFDSNYAVNGAGIYLENGNIVMKNNTFMFNRGDSGGAIYLSCLDTALNNTLPSVIDGVSSNDSKVFQQNSDGLPKKCNVLMTQGNILVNNTGRDGGAIKWTKDRPVIDLNTTNFVNNSATVYGDNIASFPKAVQLVFLSNRDYLNAFNQSGDNVTLNSSTPSQLSNQTSNSQLKMFQSNSTANTSSIYTNPTEKIGYIPPLVSGNKLDFNVYILDQDGNIYKSDSKSKATLDSAGSSAPSNSGNNLNGGQNGTKAISDVILLNNAVIAQEGVYQFRGVELRADPGSSPSLNLGFSGLQTFGNPMSFAQAPVKINTTVRQCVLGEELTVDGRCVACLEGWYQFTTPNVPVSCKKCPTDADCKGKMTVYPKPGNWRSSNTSENFMQCPNSKVCLGGDENNPQGKCDTGYQGFLCGDCAPNYSKTKEFTCGKCPPRIRNIVQTSFIIVAMAGYIAFLVRGTLMSASAKQSTSSAYMKILTNHMQILSAISGIDYQWPSQIQKFQQSQSQVTSASGQIFSFDCFLMGKDELDNGVIPIFFQKLIMQALQPVIFLLVCIIFWSTVAKVKTYSSLEYRAKLISTMIVILFLVHPDIADIMFSSFNCVKVDDKYRMTQNIRSVCYQGEHLFYISVVAFPSIGVWVMGIPLLAFLVLRRNKRVIDLMGKKEITKVENEEIFQLKTKYGFLFSGYDARAYYWEIIIMYRKILIIASSVFLSSVSPESQVLVVIFIIVVNMFLHIHMTPYTTPTLNKMESISLQVAAVTIYTGMYYVTGKSYDYMKINGVSWFFLICIVLPNLIFLTYWALSMRIEVLKTVYKICKDKNLKPWVFKIIAFTSAENFYDNHIRKEEEFEEETKQIIIDAEDVVKVEDVVLEVTAVNQDETTSNMLIDGYTKEEEQPQQVNEKKSKHKRKSRYEEDWAKLNGGMVSSRSYKVHPDEVLHRDIPRDDFYNINGQTNNEGPTDGLQFTLNDEAYENKKSKRRKQKQNQETEDFNKLHQFVEDQDGGNQNELMIIENDSFSLGEIEIEPDEIQTSPLQLNTHQNDHSARQQLIHHFASKQSPKFPNKPLDNNSPSRSPRNRSKQHQPRNEKQHKSSNRQRSESKDHHHHQLHVIESSPQLIEERTKSKDKKDKKDKKEKKEKKSKKDKEERDGHHHHGEEKRKKSHSKRTKKEERKQ